VDASAPLGGHLGDDEYRAAIRRSTVLPAPAISLVLLTLLALGTFLAGVHFLSLRISFLALALALAVPAIAWFTKSALFLVLAAIFVIGLGLALWPRLTYKRAADEP